MTNLVELHPAVLLDGKPQIEEVEYTFSKDIFNKSFELVWPKRKLRVKVSPSLLVGGKPNIYVNHKWVEPNQVLMSETQGKPGIELKFFAGPIKSLYLIPRMMEEKEYKKRMTKFEKEQYIKDHPDVVKYWE